MLSEDLENHPEYANQFPTRCGACSRIIPPGEGLLSKRPGKRSYMKGKWIIEHPDCPGAKPWELTNDGLVYVVTGAGTEDGWLKVGMTGSSLGDRILGQIGNNYLLVKFSLANSQVWAAKTSARYAAEAIAHQLLAYCRVHPAKKLGRELFRTDLITALAAVRQATGSEPEHYPWDTSGWYLKLQSDPFPQHDMGIRFSNPPDSEDVPSTRRVVRGWVVET